MKSQDEIEKAVLVFFRQDAQSASLYRALNADIEVPVLKTTLLALSKLGFITRTNAEGPRRATFCITKRGRDRLAEHYGIHLPHPDGIIESEPI